jgi:UDP-N-acetyl-D-glucosamine dehydrogenase
MGYQDDAALDLAVVGLGYVGLPLVREAVQAGMRVAGYDTDAGKVEQLNAGHSYIDDLSDEAVGDLLRTGFAATTDAGCLALAGTVILCVPTPLDEDGGPDLRALTGAARTLAARLRPGTLVVLESTSYPGTTEEVVRPILERGGLLAGRDFYLAYSPERIDPGNRTFGLRNIPKVVGGYTPNCTQAAAAFYDRLVETVVPVKGTREAELAKLLENTYRQVNIALMNELAVFCNELGIDLWNAIEAAATKPFGFQAFRPGPGVGGHCIPIDPSYLSYKVRTTGYSFRFVELAREINTRMPSYVADRAQRLLNERGKPLKGARLLLLGVAYKPDVTDDRESPARPLAKRLAHFGAEIAFHDPGITDWTVGDTTYHGVEDLEPALEDADLAILVQPHSSYDLDTIAKLSRLVLDTSGRMTADNVERL